MEIPPQMQAVFIENQQCVIKDTAVPTPGPTQVLIRVAYAGLNRADIFQRQGSYPPPEGAPNIPGLEVSGHIATLGDSVNEWQAGDAVCALLSGGGYAQYVLAEASHCLPVPAPLTLQDAAGLPECTITVWMALFEGAHVRHGESVLLHGGSSGIGTTGIQMLRAHGCEVFCTVGNEEKARFCARLGAKPILYKEQDFVTVVKEAGGVDAVLDIVGGDYIDRSLQCLKPGGRLVSLAFLESSTVEVHAGRLLMKRLSWQGMTLRARSNDEKATYIKQVRQNVWPWVARGSLKPAIDSVFPLADVAAAQEKMLKSLHCGKILLQIGDS